MCLLFDMDASLQSRIIGEAKFLRSGITFTLINIFGDVPIVLTPLDPNQLQIAQSPTAEIYNSVIVLISNLPPDVAPGLAMALRLLPIHPTLDG
jgi:hypothetical protein